MTIKKFMTGNKVMDSHSSVNDSQKRFLLKIKKKNFGSLKQKQKTEGDRETVLLGYLFQFSNT